jgi:hypothetical protein
VFEVYELLEEGLFDDFLLCGVQLIELFDEVFLGDLVEAFLADLYFLEGGQCLIQAVGFAEGVVVGLLQLLYDPLRTVLSS